MRVLLRVCSLLVLCVENPLSRPFAFTKFSRNAISSLPRHTPIYIFVYIAREFCTYRIIYSHRRKMRSTLNLKFPTTSRCYKFSRYACTPRSSYSPRAFFYSSFSLPLSVFSIKNIIPAQKYVRHSWLSAFLSQTFQPSFLRPWIDTTRWKAANFESKIFLLWITCKLIFPIFLQEVWVFFILTFLWS